MLEWQWPWLALVLPLPWIARRLLRGVSIQPAVIRVPFYDALMRAGATSSSTSLRPLSHAVFALMWLALIGAAARPVWFGEAVNVATSGRDLLLVMDISDSMRIDDMLADDKAITRVDIVKSVASDFVKRRESDRIGLILFGKQAYLQTPLTFDRDSVASQLNEAMPGFAGSSTAIGDAMGLAITLLRDRPAQSQVVILLSDGSNTYGSDPLDAMTVASEAGIKIHTIGIGAEAQRVVNATGQLQDIDPSRDLDEETLRRVAAETGGQYFRARNPRELATIYTTIDDLEPAPVEEYVRPRRTLYHWPLSVALVLYLFSLSRRQGELLS